MTRQVNCAELQPMLSRLHHYHLRTDFHNCLWCVYIVVFNIVMFLLGLQLTAATSVCQIGNDMSVISDFSKSAK
jgi:hypothetical protein